MLYRNSNECNFLIESLISLREEIVDNYSDSPVCSDIYVYSTLACQQLDELVNMINQMNLLYDSLT